MGSPVSIGLDLSLTSTGVASYDSELGWEVSRFATTGTKGDGLEQRGERLRRIYTSVIAWCLDDGVDLVVIESPSYGSKFGSPHDRSGLWWMIVSRLQDECVPIGTVTPQGRAMYGTGKGTSPKPDVTAAVMGTYGANIEWPAGKKDDVADAVLLAAMGMRYLGHPVEVDLPATHTRALQGAAWPTGLAA